MLGHDRPAESATTGSQNEPLLLNCSLADMPKAGDLGCCRQKLISIDSTYLVGSGRTRFASLVARRSTGMKMAR